MGAMAATILARMRFPALMLGLAAALPTPAAAITGDVVVLQGLDKITARISTFEAPISEPVRFGTLEIVARSCDKTPPEEPPENAAFLEIREVKQDEAEPVDLYAGWMFSSSPALAALEHPIYDVWVLECKISSTSSSSKSE